MLDELPHGDANTGRQLARDGREPRKVIQALEYSCVHSLVNGEGSPLEHSPSEQLEVVLPSALASALRDARRLSKEGIVEVRFFFYVGISPNRSFFLSFFLYLI